MFIFQEETGGFSKLDSAIPKWIQLITLKRKLNLNLLPSAVRDGKILT
jgi:hypothetical protein